MLSKELAEIAVAGLLHDVGKVFQRADWPLSQAASRLEEELCPQIDGKPVHRHVLWTYDFCNDNLKWLADYLDMARVIKLAVGHHSDSDATEVAVIAEANRLAAGVQGIEIEEMQPVIPPQEPLESVLWHLTARKDLARARARRSSDAGQQPEGQGPTDASEAEPAERKGFFRLQMLVGEDVVLPRSERPEVGEQEYKALCAEIVGAVQRIGRGTVRLRLDWIIDALRSVLERRLSLVPAYVGEGGKCVSLYTHGLLTAALASVLWQGQGEGDEGRGRFALVASEVCGVEEFLCRPVPSEGASRIVRARAFVPRLIARLLSEMLLQKLGLSSVNRLVETDTKFLLLVRGDDESAELIRQFRQVQSRRLFEQSGGWLRFALSEPVRLDGESLLSDGWREAWARLGEKFAEARLDADRAAAAGGGDGRPWLLPLTDRHGQEQSPAQWLRLQEAYERQLGTNLARARCVAVYNAPVMPTGSESEPLPVGEWFVHVGGSPEGFVGWEGLERIYAFTENAEPWGWVPRWEALPHAPTFRRADESQLRADPSPELMRLGTVPRRRETPMGFEEVGWLSRRSRGRRGFVGRPLLGCLRLRIDAQGEDWAVDAAECDRLGEAVEALRQMGWFWQQFLESQLGRTDRATWRVFVLKSGDGEGIFVGPWNTIMTFAARAEKWWRQWIGSARWQVNGSVTFGERDCPVWHLVRQAEAGLLRAELSEGPGGRIWCFGRGRTWAALRQGLVLASLFEEQLAWPALAKDGAGQVFLSRLLQYDGQVQRMHAAGRSRYDSGEAAAWRARLAQDVRKLILRRLPGRARRTPQQQEFVNRLQKLVTTARGGRLPAALGVALRVALWQNQGEVL